MNFKEQKKLIEMLKKNGVQYYEHDNIKIQFELQPVQPFSMPGIKEEEEVQESEDFREEDIYFSRGEIDNDEL